MSQSFFIQTFTWLVCAVFSSVAWSQVDVSDAWARASVQGQRATGAFMKISSKDGAKIVGISQRRTRDLARFQCTMYLQWETVLSQQFGLLLNDPSAALVEMQSNLEHSVMPLNRLASGLTASDVLAAFMAKINRV